MLSLTVIFSWVGILKLRIQSCALFKKEQCWSSTACLLLNNYYTWLEYLGKYIPTHAWTLEVSPGKAQLSREDLAWITDNINPHVISWYLARSQRIKLYTLNEETFGSKLLVSPHFVSKIRLHRKLWREKWKKQSKNYQPFMSNLQIII